ncbi:hypothetical protein C8J57DRAFT_1284697 [Mycena rebaudengoi]|nr:hypothetical protein C8J57DRAFT_1284697 [Mycena rebaudengoi]
MRDPIMKTGSDSTPEAQAFMETLDPRFREVIKQTVEHREFRNQVYRETYRSTTLHDVPDKPDLSPAEIPSSLPETLTKKQKRKQKSKQNMEKERRKREAERKILEVVPGACTLCQDLPDEEKCVRIVEVTERNCKKYIGCALTCAEPDDRLKPKPPPAVDGVHPEPTKVRYVHPDDLSLQTIAFREKVFLRCGKDIVRFIHKKPGSDDFVGGVRFMAFKPETLARLHQNHRQVLINGVNRRESMRAWAVEGSSMTGRGSRQPSGGIQGDGYGPYANETAETIEGIKALGRGASDTDALATVGATIYPGMRKELRDLTQQAELNRFGQSGLSTFYCTNYISPIHNDHDMGSDDVKEGRSKANSTGGYYPCAQLIKSNCADDEFNFAMLRWGIIIRTMTNSVWVFNGRHEHGTVMPRNSTLRLRGGASEGIHPTNRGQDVTRAVHCREVRGNYNLRLRIQ